jgi:outer membrane protein assembly factor BamB
MGRSNMRASDSVGAYNVVTFANGKATFEERKHFINNDRKWSEANLYDHHFIDDTTRYSRPSYAINNAYPNVRMLWQHQGKYDIGGGTTAYKDFIISTNTSGLVLALDEKNGQQKWSHQTKGKIYSTPAVSSNHVVVASTDSNLYCLDGASGRLLWKYKTLKPIVSSPAIYNGIVYIGSSEGKFWALNLATGKIKWQYAGVTDFVMTKPLVYNDKVYFGSWGNDFYALTATNGKLAWKWKNTSNNRMFSPAGCRPVATKGKVFIVAPDLFMTSFEASTGNVLWRTKLPSVKVRESMGLSADSSLVYVKTTDGKLNGISTSTNEMQTTLNVSLQIGYDICAAPIIENKGVVYVPSNSGVVSAVDRQSGKLLWKYKTSNCNITSILPSNNNTVVVSTEDGKVTCLEINHY